MEHSVRWMRLQQKMREQQIDGYIATQNVDCYYLSGSMQTGYLFIPAEGEPVFYVRRSVARAREESAAAVEELGAMRTLGERIRSRYPSLFEQEQVVIATPWDVLPVQLYRRIEALFPQAAWVDGSVMTRELRMIKSNEEMEAIREAARVIDLALEYALARLYPGMAEFELIAEIEYAIRRHGHIGIMRMRGYNQEIVTGMVGAGAAMAKPTYFDGPGGGEGMSPASPQGAGRASIQVGDPILIDIGCSIGGYIIDQTRTVVIGELDPELQAAYDVSEAILREVEQNLRPGIICEDLYKQAVIQAEEAGLGEHFMGYGADQVKFLGHGIGLEIDEFPVLARGFKYPLEVNMVIAIEPKFTFPGRGVVGIENSYRITETGFEKLTQSLEGVRKLAIGRE